MHLKNGNGKCCNRRNKSEKTPTGLRFQVEAPLWPGTLPISFPFYPVNLPHFFFAVVFVGFWYSKFFFAAFICCVSVFSVLLQFFHCLCGFASFLCWYCWLFVVVHWFSALPVFLPHWQLLQIAGDSRLLFFSSSKKTARISGVLLLANFKTAEHEWEFHKCAAAAQG